MMNICICIYIYISTYIYSYISTYTYGYGYIHHKSSTYPKLCVVTDTLFPSHSCPGHHAPLTLPHVVQARHGKIIGLGSMP